MCSSGVPRALHFPHHTPIGMPHPSSYCISAVTPYLTRHLSGKIRAESSHFKITQYNFTQQVNSTHLFWSLPRRWLRANDPFLGSVPSNQQRAFLNHTALQEAWGPAEDSAWLSFWGHLSSTPQDRCVWLMGRERYLVTPWLLAHSWVAYVTIGSPLADWKRSRKLKASHT